MKLLKIGSNPQNDIVYQSNKVSGMHAEITLLNNGDILLEDKNSLNGTYVMNQRIKPATAVTIRRGDAVRFADSELQWSQVPYPEDNSMYSKVLGIGSNFRNEIQVTGNTVSRFHATLKVDKQGRAFIEDHSMNGTTVNGQRIASHQNIRVKPSDAVAVGGVPINMKQFVGSDKSNILKIVGAVAAIAAVVALAIILWPKKTESVTLPVQTSNQPVALSEEVVETSPVPPVTPKKINPDIHALMRATPCVYGAYYIDVTIKDDPFDGLVSGWPKEWTFGLDSRNEWALGTLTNNRIRPCGYTGTAFFISENGELGTNRHIAVPWEYESKQNTERIRQQMQEAVGNGGNLLGQLAEILQNNIDKGVISEKTATAYLERFFKSDIEISGHFDFLGVLLPGQSYSSTEDFMRCQVIAESGNKDIDVAMMRLNNPKTPDAIIKDGYYSMETARLDETEIQIGEQLYAWGYPAGIAEGFALGKGKELNPFYSDLKVSKIPHDYQFEVQGTALKGSSGSPVFDTERNLVGVLWGVMNGAETINYICNIKYLNDLYEKYNYGKHHQK